MSQDLDTHNNAVLPANVLAAVATCQARVTLVIGAGCSLDPPTNLPTGRDAARQAYQSLVANGVVQVGAGIDSGDLTSVADAAFSKTGSNEAIVDALNPARFANASPNRGHEIAAALLMEGCLRDVLTINYDLAMSSALTKLGAGASVGNILSESHHNRLIARNVIYVNGSAYSSPQEWILTTDQLETAWQGNWAQLITERATLSPIVLFAGLGSSAAVLSSAAQRVRGAIPSGVFLCFVNPSQFQDCLLAHEMGITTADYVKMNWLDLMDTLGKRLCTEQLQKIESALQTVVPEDPLRTEVSNAFLRLRERFDLLLIGKIRADWLLEAQQYRPEAEAETSLLAVLISALSIIINRLNAEILIEADGRVRLIVGGNSEILILIGSGRGFRRFGAVRSRLREKFRRTVCPASAFAIALVGSTLDDDAQTGVIPDQLIDDEEPESLVTGGLQLRTIGCSALLDDPTTLEEMLART